MEPVLFYYGAFILVSLLQLASSRVDGYGGWNDSPNTQYHIQTDEGEERYFKYQTKTGQYRKEKRLQDGTVVGTYGWVDPNGFLRLRDYIADNAGYRILKSRMLFVGDGADVGNSVAAAKNVPASGGELASPNSSPFNINNYAVVPNRAVYNPPSVANRHYYNPTPTPQPIYVPPIVNQGSTPASTFRLNLGPQYFPSSTPAPYYSQAPVAYPGSTPQTVHIYPSSTPSPVRYYTAAMASTTARPYTGSTPQSVHLYPSSTPAPAYYSSTPHYYPSSTPSPIHYYPSSTPNVDIHPNADPNIQHVYVSSTPSPSSTIRPIVVYSQTPRPVAVNYVSSRPTSDSYVTSRPDYQSVTPSPTLSAIGYTASTPSPQPRPQPISGKYASSVNNFITETEKNKAFYQYENNRQYYNNKKRFVDYKPVDQEYDGISTVQNGFRYFLPKQYHEEQSSKDGQERTGSFGYVDPFGIRRVVYYNSSPGRGFVHRKNNRYVGHDAAPYDPRPS